MIDYNKYLISEEYRLDEKMNASKALKKLEDKLKSISSRNELVLAGKMLVQFIKLFPDTYTDEVSKKLTDLMSKAKAKVGS